MAMYRPKHVHEKKIKRPFHSPLSPKTIRRVFMVFNYYFTDDLEIFEETEENTTDQGEQQMVDKDLPEQTSPSFECRKSLRTKK